MSEEENKQEPAEPKAFTQEQVNALLADQKRKLGEKFADYDDVKAKASKLDQLEQDSKSELQKLLDENTELKTKVGSFEQEKQVTAWAAEIVKDSTIPASVLRGNTKEELEAHFKDLQELAPKPKRTPVPTGQPSGEGTGSRAATALRELRGTQ